MVWAFFFSTLGANGSTVIVVSGLNARTFGQNFGQELLDLRATTFGQNFGQARLSRTLGRPCWVELWASTWAELWAELWARLWASNLSRALGGHFEQTFRQALLARTLGNCWAELWAGAFGHNFGQAILGRTLGNHFGAELWASPFGQNFGQRGLLKVWEGGVGQGSLPKVLGGVYPKFWWGARPKLLGRSAQSAAQSVCPKFGGVCPKCCPKCCPKFF